MKANELTYGDYVIANYGVDRIVQVRSVTRKKIGFHLTENETRMYHCQLCQVKPILLTKDVLKINRFVKSTDAQRINSWDYRFHGKHFSVCMPDDQLPFIPMLGYIDCEFVNEFQHALRLYGLYELAENLKIE